MNVFLERNDTFLTFFNVLPVILFFLQHFLNIDAINTCTN